MACQPSSAEDTFANGSGDDMPSSLPQSRSPLDVSAPGSNAEHSSPANNPDSRTGSVEEESQSLSPSVKDYPEQFGRRYHAYRQGSYAFPNDLPERERLAIQNEALVKLFGGRLFLAPLEAVQPRAILDVATGTGDWAIQMGDMFPNAEVIATDLSPIQPDQVPPNVHFFVEDSSEPWQYARRFDYIHTRVTSGCWSSFEDQIVRQAHEWLEPGGYLEAQEVGSLFRCDDGTLGCDSHLNRWARDLQRAARTVDRPLDFADKMQAMLRRAGFVDVQERIFKMPLNAWPRDEERQQLGRLWERNFSSGMTGFSVSLFHQVFARSPAETEISLIPVRRQLGDAGIHAYLPIHVVWGRKPHPGDGGASQLAKG